MFGDGLEALVLHRVEQQAVEALEHRQHRLAAGRGPAAEHGGDLVDGQQLLGLLGERRPVGRAVLDDGLDLLAEHAAGVVDLLDGEQLGVADRDLADRHRAAQRVQDADLDAVRPRAALAHVSSARRRAAALGPGALRLRAVGRRGLRLGGGRLRALGGCLGRCVVRSDVATARRHARIVIVIAAACGDHQCQRCKRADVGPGPSSHSPSPSCSRLGRGGHLGRPVSRLFRKDVESREGERQTNGGRLASTRRRAWCGPT